MKKISKFLSAVLLSSLISGSVFAMPTSEMAIGGVTPGSPLSYVENIYGNPDRTEKVVNNLYRQYEAYWGKGYKMKVLSNGNVNAITTYANNGLGTPAGLAVGQNIQVMYDLYGSPATTNNFKRDGYIRHHYRNTLDSGKDYVHSMNMVVKEKKGKIIEISCYESYEGPVLPYYAET